MRALSLALLAPVASALSYARAPEDAIPQSAPGVTSEPNVVTPLLPDQYEKAQNNSRVHLEGYNTTDLYSGFFDIDSSTGSNTYFVFSTAVSGRKDAPVLLWLNGGPGASSLLGFYDELGPFGIDQDMQIKLRTVGWNRDCHLLALDNPLGVGYSHTQSLARMVTNETTVGADLYEALRQFFELFPELRDNAFYAAGESYAGKYVPAVSFTIHTRNQKVEKSQRINLQGISIGDGAFDPASQFTGFGPLLFSIGLADTRAVKTYEEYDKRLTAALAKGDYIGAFRSFDEMLNGDYYGQDRTFYANTTAMGSNYFNFALEPGASSLTKRTFPSWLARPEIAEAMHVGSVPYAIYNQTVEDQLLGDWVRGVVPMLEVLLDNYNVLVYSGQYDVILGPPGTMRALDKLQWSGSASYKAAPTVPFFTEAHSDDGSATATATTTAEGETNAPTTDLAGYSRRAVSASNKNFSYVVLRGCGHMVPTDQPVRAYEMLREFLVPMAPLPPSVHA